MSYTQATAIRTAVTELLEGSIGSVRTVTAGTFKAGVFAGKSVPGQQSKAMDHRYTHRFDVQVRSAGRHEATPMSVGSAPYKLTRMRVEISIWTRLKADTRDDARADQRARIEGDCDTAIQALNYRGNLVETDAGDPTGIVSGLLQGPEGESTPTWELVEENWQEHLLRSRIVAEAVVTQAQAVA